MSDQSYCFPIYLYPDSNLNQENFKGSISRHHNLNLEILEKISNEIGLVFTDEKEESKTTFSPIDLLDYMYAILHSLSYRKKYKAFLKIDFPRIPYPNDKSSFWGLVLLGGKLRKSHLLESDNTQYKFSSYPHDGNNKVTRKINKDDWELYNTEDKLGRIWINDEQYFDEIPLIAWEFYIGGYQPAQKWLKDRKERELSFDDILHYQKIISSLMETDRIMKEIDKIDFE